MLRTLALFALLAGLALPLAAEFSADATTLTWFSDKPTQVVTDYRNALLWHYEGQPLDGLLATSARTNVTLTDLGGGNSRLAIAMPLGAGNSWVAALVATVCPSASTHAERRVCADPLIKSDLKRILRNHRTFLREQSTPVAEPPDL